MCHVRLRDTRVTQLCRARFARTPPAVIRVCMKNMPYLPNLKVSFPLENMPSQYHTQFFHQKFAPKQPPRVTLSSDSSSSRSTSSDDRWRLEDSDVDFMPSSSEVESNECDLERPRWSQVHSCGVAGAPPKPHQYAVTSPCGLLTKSQGFRFTRRNVSMRCSTSRWFSGSRLEWPSPS